MIPSKTGALLSCDVHTEWSKYGGKKLVASDKIGSDNTVSVNGLEYDLVTATDASEMSDTDASEIAGNDDFAEEMGEDETENELTEGEKEMRGVAVVSASPSAPPKKSSFSRVKNPLKKMNSFAGPSSSSSVCKRKSNITVLHAAHTVNRSLTKYLRLGEKVF